MVLPLILLPGLMCDARLFAPQIAALSGRHSVTVAFIGGHDRVCDIATQVMRDAPDRFALAGLSMGGIVALEMLARAPGRIARLALLDTNADAELPERQALRDPQMARVGVQGLAAVMTNEDIPNYFPADCPRPDLAALCLDMALSLGPQVFARQSRALRDRADRLDALMLAPPDTLILCGREDRLCPVAKHRDMQARAPGSRLVVIDRAGHLPTLEQPDLTTKALQEWMT